MPSTKRKLNERNVPTESPASPTQIRHSVLTTNAGREVPLSAPVAGPEFRGITTFGGMSLDPRLLQAISGQDYAHPTPVQAKAIPLALEGKDILARSRTGSGKTAAYVLPVLQALLGRKEKAGTQKRHTAALILVPTKELAGQVNKAIVVLASACGDAIRAENVTRKEDDRVLRARLAAKPDILVSTPGKVATLLKSSQIDLSHLSHLVVDEADLILTYGYEADLQEISHAIPKGVQTFLMSATLKADVEELKGLFCRDPVIVSCEEDDKLDMKSKLTQYVIRTTESEKFLLLYAIFKLRLVSGKTIIFVGGGVDRCYRVRLFLEQFGIKSVVLNEELPVNSRIHVVEEFSRGIYDILIAGDEREVLGRESVDKKREVDQDKEGLHEFAEEDMGDGIAMDKPSELTGDSQAPRENSDDDNNEDPTASREPSKKKRKRDFQAQRQDRNKDPDYGISRGIDFQSVACVLNFDLPSSSRSYTHRIGRTARAGRSGIAISFVIPPAEYRRNKKDRDLSLRSTEKDEKVLARIEKSQEKKGHVLQDYHFDTQALTAFQYRLQSALQHVTSGAIREARLRELKRELIRSEKLKRHFEENPEELRLLTGGRRDGELRPARVQGHLKHVPEYLVPGGDATARGGVDSSLVGFQKLDKDRNKIRLAREKNRSKKRGAVRGVRKGVNPLKTFRAKK